MITKKIKTQKKFEKYQKLIILFNFLYVPLCMYVFHIKNKLKKYLFIVYTK